MSSVRSDNQRQAQYQDEDWREAYPPPASRRDESGPPWGLLMTGLAVVGLGLIAWNYLGPDVRRYLKIRDM